MKFSLAHLSLQITVAFMIFSCDANMPKDVELAYRELPEKIDLNFHVRPILSDRCFHCHGPDEKARKANLRLDIKDNVFSVIPQKDIFPIVSSNPQESAVIERILSHDPEYAMPPLESKLVLTAEEKATLIKWVEPAK